MWRFTIRGKGILVSSIRNIKQIEMVALLFPGNQALAKDALQELLLHAVRLIEWGTDYLPLVESVLPVDGP
jgi:hypothetical protein